MSVVKKYYIKLGKVSGYYTPTTKTLGATTIVSMEKLGELVKAYGEDASIDIDHCRAYSEYDDCTCSLEVTYERSVTNQELALIEPQIEKLKEEERKRNEKNKLADQKRKLAYEKSELKTYERLRKKYGEAKG